MTADPVRRDAQMSLIEGERSIPVGPIPPSVYSRPTNAELMAAIAPLYLRGSVLDVTYGRGRWWTRYTPAPFACHDLALDGVDFRALPEADRSWDTVCFDPPYVPSQRSNTVARTERDADFRDRFGLDVPRSNRETKQLMLDGLAETSRVMRRWLLVKCTDYSNGRQFHLGHVLVINEAERLGLRCHDLIIHASGPGPGGSQITHLRRARRTHSYLVVLERKGRKS